MSDILVLHNQTAGNGEPMPGRLLALIKREGYRPHYFDLNAGLADPGQLPEVDFIVIAGGDGSFRRAALQLRDRKCPFALLPLGTANNIARSLGIQGTAAEIIAGWEPAARRRFNVGLARGPWGEKSFVEGLGVGLFGRIIDILSRVQTNTAHTSAAGHHRVASDLRSTTVLAHEMAPLALTAIADGEIISGDFLLFEVMNIGRVGAGIQLASADTADGFFDVVTAELTDREKLLETLGNVAKEVRMPSCLSVRRCRQVELTLPPCALRLDDQIAPIFKSARIEISMDTEGIEVLSPGPKE